MEEGEVGGGRSWSRVKLEEGERGEEKLNMKDNNTNVKKGDIGAKT